MTVEAVPEEFLYKEEQIDVVPARGARKLGKLAVLFFLESSECAFVCWWK